MKNYPRLTAESCIDQETGCLYRYVYGAMDIFNPHCHDFYEIFITINGNVTHFINNSVQVLPEGSLVLIRPDDIHGYLYDSPESKNTSYVNLTFTRETTENLFEYLADIQEKEKLLFCDMPPVITLNKTQKKRLLSQLSELNLLNHHDKKALKLRMRAILAEIFVLFFFNVPINSQNDMPTWLSVMMQEMEQPSNFIAGMERMIELSGKSREHIARSLKKYYGTTSSDYINELRLNYAANLLKHTNTSVIDICFTCGFQNISYFYKMFKNKYSLSPSKFRKQQFTKEYNQKICKPIENISS